MPMPGHEGEHKHGEMECSMSMLWNTSTRGICVVFPSWKVTGHQSLLGTLVALFLLSMLLEYLRLCVSSLDARLIASNQLSSGILSALTGNPSHRRKASVQHRHVSQGVSGGGAALLSSGVNATLGERRQTPTDSTSSSWNASDDDAPLLPAASGSRRTRRTSLWTRMQRAVV